MGLEFHKFQAVGNDFILVEDDQLRSLKDLDLLAKRMCQRHLGIGADGVIIVTPLKGHDEADFQMRLFNADGSEAEVSGNGLRCLAAYLYFVGKWNAAELRVLTKAGVSRLQLISRQGAQFQFLTEIGKPRLASEEIPMALEPPLPRVIHYPLEVGGQTVRITACSVGVPHCTIFLEDFGSVDFYRLGPAVERHPLFPARTNVEFVRILDRHRIELRMWERGVGETLSSGTGASAATIAAVLNGLTERKVIVKTAGGDMLVVWRDDDVITVTGAAEPVFKGEWLGGAKG